jgi:hypothetical protein
MTKVVGFSAHVERYAQFGAVEKIAAAYGLDAGKLDSKLRHLVSGGYDVANLSASEPGAKDTKKLLHRLEKQASELKKTLGGISIYSSLHAELFHKYKHLYVLRDKELPNLIEAAGSITPKDKRGVSADTLKRDMLITHMAKFWFQQTGKQPTYSTDRVTEERFGIFLDFLNEIALLLDVDPSPLPERFIHLKKNRVLTYK